MSPKDQAMLAELRRRGDPAPVKVVQQGPQVNAKEWALRTADNIVDRHMPDAPFAIRASLAKDIAENLQSVFDMQELVRTFNRIEDKDKLTEAIQRHRSDIWGPGSIGHPDDADLYRAAGLPDVVEEAMDEG